MEQTGTLKPKEAVVVALSAQGKSSRAIAATPGVDMSYSTANRINNKHKELIQQQQARLVDATLSRIADRTIKEIKHANTLSTNDLMLATNQQALARIDKKEDAILKATGINASHAPSIHIQQIFNDNTKTLISPQVSDLLGTQLDSIIDADYNEMTSDDK